ncbi:preprotein translocase subunit SecY, partial [Mycoplasmopsis pullorum]
NNAFFDTLNLVGGGGLSQFSIFALGISPFINSSLIMMVLQSRLFPPVYKLSQSGPQGRRKINIITRIITVVIAYPQAIFLTKSLQNSFITITGTDLISIGQITYFYIPIILTAASLFALFLSEQITNKGIGNGTSLIIFVGIAMRLPAQFRGAYIELAGNSDSQSTAIGTINFAFYVLVFLFVVLIISIVYNAERHIPIQQVGSGRSRNIKEMGK